MKSSLPRLLVPAAVVLVGTLALAACGSTSAGSSASGSSSPAASVAYVTGTGGVTVSGAEGSAPTVTVTAETGKVTQLTVSDITVGTGDPVAPGATVSVQYLGVGGISGKAFDSSWERGEPATFPLSNVITGWQNGIPGMKMGGRRLLVIPGDQAYGANPPAGSGIAANEPLVFVVDLVPTPTPTVGPHVTGMGGVTVTGAAGSAPTITVSAETGKVSQLTITDLVVGTGADVAPGATVTAHYTGVGGISGKKFDSSWDRGQPAQFPLANVIQGWQDGIPGMKVGGRRLLVIPGAQAYGANPPSGSGIAVNEPLVFVVDIVSSP